MFVGECGEAAARGRGPSDIVDQDVDAPQAIQNVADDLLGAFGRTDVGPHEQVRPREVRGSGPSRGDHRGSRTSEALDDGFAHALGSAGYERPLATEFGLVGAAHPCTSTHGMTMRTRLAPL